MNIFASDSEPAAEPAPINGKLIRASAVRERVTPWAGIGGARVGIAELGQHLPSLIVEGMDGVVLVAYGEGLINRPLEEAAGLINERARKHRSGELH